MIIDLEDDPGPRYRARRVQLVETTDGVIVKRGVVELRVIGDRAAAAVSAVLTAADGATAKEILREFPPDDHSAVTDLIGKLADRRLLSTAVPADDGGSPTEGDSDVFYWHLGLSSREVVERLNRRRIVIMGVSVVSGSLARSLAASGVENVEVVNYPLLCNLRLLDDDGEVSTERWGSNLPRPLDYGRWRAELDPDAIGCVVATSDFGGMQLMRPWNEFAVANGLAFLPVVLQDLVGTVGPLVIPGQTPCYECFRARENSHMSNPVVARATEDAAFAGQAVSAFHPSFASILGDLAALELAKYLGGWLRPRSIGSLIQVDLLGPRLTHRRLLKVPRCTVCGVLTTRSQVNLDRGVRLVGTDLYPAHEPDDAHAH